MVTNRLRKALDHLQSALTPPGAEALTDAQLLARFLAGRDEAGETTWKPVYNVATKDGVVVSATVKVPLTVLMPSWPGASKLSKAAHSPDSSASSNATQVGDSPRPDPSSLVAIPGVAI